MKLARESTVRGDFRGATYEVRGKPWRFFRVGDKYMVTAEGPDSELADFEVTHTFGVEPLQQYLVAQAGGRLQALPVAWDTREKRWFALATAQTAPPGDWLHWTQQGQNWNSMCADCHATNVQKGYDDTTRAFHTTYAELGVGCESCHGPGSRHVANPASAHDARALHVEERGPSQVERCAACHARRAQIADHGAPGAPLLDRYVPAVLEPGVFHADGQILDEDFEYQSFVQSKMYAKGVGCSDCHDAHSGKLRSEGNALCTRCHEANVFDTPAHHGHAVVADQSNPGARCVACHMPGQTYMVVHFRRDHSLRVPQPAITSAIGAPNACVAAGCHAAQSPAWIASSYTALFGQRPRAQAPHWGTVLAAARNAAADPATVIALATDTALPAIARATALTYLDDSDASRDVLEHALADADPLLRHTAITSYPIASPERLVAALSPQLLDPIRAVRVAALARLVEVPAALRATVPAATFSRVQSEYFEMLRYMADQPSGPFNLGNLFANLGRDADAEQQFRRAIEIDGRFVQAKVNLALLLARSARQSEAEALLRSVGPSEPGFATAAFNLGLLVAERGDAEVAEHALRHALEVDPTLASAAYNLAVLIMKQRPAEATALLRRASELAPREIRYVRTLAMSLLQTGDPEAAANILEGAVRTHPDDRELHLLLRVADEARQDRR